MDREADAFDIVVRGSSGTVNVRLIGELDMATVGKLDVLNESLESRPSLVVLDMGKLTSMDSSGIGALLRFVVRAEELGVPFRCKNPNAIVRKTLFVSGLSQRFGV